jgi:ABC-type transport system substrate-binding protein
VVISDYPWSDLNPVFQDDTASAFISSSVLDPLIWFDDDSSYWPHLAKNVNHINDTYIRITLREGVKWQTDSEGLFTNEYFDAEDLYFTIFVNKVYNYDEELAWIRDFKIIDKHTLDIFIDGDPSTPELDPYAPYLRDIAVKILPEHYLNQTQDPYGIPDITHSSWAKFATHCFGTGLFSIDSYTQGVETILAINPDCWWLNTTITNDPDLNWLNRFGDFSGIIEHLRVKQFFDQYISFAEFEMGRIDIEEINFDRSKRLSLAENPDILIQNEIKYYFSFVAYNMRPIRSYIGQSYTPWEYDPSISKGLAIRKAISYAIDREEINQIIHGGDYEINDYPIYAKLGIWCNPNITRYNHDLEKARYYMQGFNDQSIVSFEKGFSTLFFLAEILILSVVINKRRRR